MQTPTVREIPRVGAMAPVEFIDEPRTVRETSPARDVCDPRVPRAAMQDALELARKAYPEATRLVALWTPTSSNDVCVEVWTNDRARVIPAHMIGVSA